jgi:hypothetical protein
VRECLSLLILLSLLYSCGGGSGTERAADFQPSIPIVLIVFNDFPLNTVLPWTARGISPDSSACLGMLATDHSGNAPDIVSMLISEAARENRLLLLVDCPSADSGHQRESMRILSGSDGNPSLIEPPGIETELENCDWSDPVGRQMAVIRLMEMNLPDVVVIQTSGLDPITAREVCRIWMEQTSSGRLRVSFYAPPGPLSGRGWVILAGPGIGNGNVIGMTPLDYLATLRVLTGLPWGLSISEGIPGLAVLTVLPPSLTRDGTD